MMYIIKEAGRDLKQKPSCVLLLLLLLLLLLCLLAKNDHIRSIIKWRIVSLRWGIIVSHILCDYDLYLSMYLKQVTTFIMIKPQQYPPIQKCAYVSSLPISVSARSKAWVCGRSLMILWVRIPPAVWIFVPDSVLCCQRPVQRADHPFRGILPNMMRRYVRSWSLDNEEAMPKGHTEKKK